MHSTAWLTADPLGACGHRSPALTGKPLAGSCTWGAVVQSCFAIPAAWAPSTVHFHSLTITEMALLPDCATPYIPVSTRRRHPSCCGQQAVLSTVCSRLCCSPEYCTHPAAALTAAGPAAYLATKRRNERTLQLFHDHAGAAGLALQDISCAAHQAAIQFVANTCLQDRESVIVHRITLC
jgi:hypothetical protein